MAAARVRSAAPRLTSTSAPGSCTSARFFDDYPRFYETSRTAASTGRLNLRYDAIFGQNRDIFAGAKVLDIASHDGRWSLAALACGAESVIGIEARPELAAHAAENLERYGFGTERYSFITGDINQVFDKQSFDVDVVLCLGFLYHTLRYNELLSGIRRANPRHVLIDTQARDDAGQGSDRLPAAREREQAGRRGRRRVHLRQVGVVRASEPARRSGRWSRLTGSRWSGCPTGAGCCGTTRTLDGASDYAAQKRMTIRCVDTSQR